MIGRKFSRLTVIEQIGTRDGKRIWRCMCDCGNTVMPATGDITSGNTKSCGCLKRDMSTKHGQHKTRTYTIWQAMLNRCRQGQHKKYYRHITVCERWKQFANFLADMGDAPEGLTLDRADNNLGYSPENCRWVDRKIQARNTRRRKEYAYMGQLKSLIEWSETLNINYEMLRGRIRRGVDFDRAISNTYRRSA